jgi:thiamine monophosphate synthase
LIDKHLGGYEYIMDRIENLKQLLKEKKCVKVIAGIDNFNVESVRNVVSAAEQGGASAVDVAARKEIIQIAKSMTDMPVFVSSISPEELAMAADNGADVLEIGNFDALYKKGLRITAQEVLDITKRTIELVGNDIMISVTVPGHIDISEQIILAQKLENLGVDLIQTEGAAITEPTSSGARGLMEKAQVSIANTIELVRNIDIPVMTASGITTTTAPLAIAAGASAVGVGSCVNKLNSILAMIAEVRSIVEAVEKTSSTKEEKFLI